jgi:hypothetical protein
MLTVTSPEGYLGLWNDARYPQRPLVMTLRAGSGLRTLGLWAELKLRL